MSGAQARPSPAGNYVFDRNTDHCLPDLPVEHTTASDVHGPGDLIQAASSALTRVASEPSTAPPLKPVVASAGTALQRGGSLVQGAVGSASASRQAPEHASVNICLAEVEDLVCAWQNKVRLDARIGRGLPDAKCDPAGLQNALVNLILNARDAGPDGALVSISAAAIVQGTDTFVELRVKDSGIGMTRDTMLRAFEPFFTTKGTGLGGVGLTMVKHFVEQHGGGVNLESALGSGTTVILRLPAI
ncbi:ATP-binding protein [Sinorhizobium meliloti]|uniref:sensor histidine kinase n=1 Tax=Rhizobium meliloti TaxID=382 RepID=UPI000FD9112D|nr:ATP-binding protein [Sinorhizobium meliloti]MDE3819627.1 ATP-binding protein [Sinorhizobium meliloti]MDW9984198.1 ATP-binding protein [Sinorhizobium meliloti]MDX0269967.1 ATP-binding protein [Sinorhizobium meliloti]MQX74491.1 ATP-binding protein [Sinorhizobium meliloti]RVI63252.1 ATP-binding protein [Sinorhizobium meliloti]